MAEDRAHDPARKPNLGLPSFVQEKLDKKEASKKQILASQEDNHNQTLIKNAFPTALSGTVDKVFAKKKTQRNPENDSSAERYYELRGE